MKSNVSSDEFVLLTVLSEPQLFSSSSRRRNSSVMQSRFFGQNFAQVFIRSADQIGTAESIAHEAVDCWDVSW